MKGRKLLALFSAGLVVLVAYSCAAPPPKTPVQGTSQQAQLEKAEQLYTDAAALYRAGEYAQAKSKFLEVKAMYVDIGDRRRAGVENYLARIDEKLAEVAKEQAKAPWMTKFAEAEKLYGEGRHAEAKPLLLSIKESGVDLGRGTTRRVSSYLQAIDQQEAGARDLEATLARGVQLFDSGDYEAALQAFKEVAASRQATKGIRAVAQARVSKTEAKLAEAKEQTRQAELAKEAKEKEAREAEQAKEKEAAELYDKAGSLYSAGDYKSAKAVYQELQAKGEYLSARQRSNVERRLGSIDEIMAKNESEARAAAEAEASKEAEAKLATAKEQARQAALAKEKAAREAELAKEKAAREAEQANEKEAGELYDKAGSLYSAGDYKSAKALYQELQAKGEYLSARQRGNVDKRLGSIDEIIAKKESEARAAAEAEASKEAQAKLAEAKEQARQAELAKEKAAREADLAKEKATREAQQAKEKEAAERAKAEAEASKKAQEVAKAKAMALFDQGESLYKAGNYAEAKTALEAAKAGGVELGRSVERKIASYLQQIEEQEALAVDRQKAKNLHAKGLAALQARDYETAINYMRQAESSKGADSELRASARKFRKDAEAGLAEAKEQAKEREKLIADLDGVKNLLDRAKYDEALKKARDIQSKRKSLGPDADARLAAYVNQATAKLSEAEQAAKAEQMAKEKAAVQPSTREAEQKKVQRAEKDFAEAERLYRDGKLAEAKALFEKVRASGVSLAKRTDQKLASYLESIDREMAARKGEEEGHAAAVAALKRGIDLLQQKKYEDALSQFDQVSSSKGKLSKEEQAQLESYIAQTKGALRAQEQTRKSEAQAKEVKDRLAKASQLLEEGHPAEAKAALDALVASGLPLTREDEGSVEELASKISRGLQAQQVKPVQAVAPAPSRGGEADLQRRYKALWEAFVQEETVRQQEQSFRAQKLLEEANQLIDQQEFASALEKLDEAIKLNPELEEAKHRKQVVESILGTAPAYRPIMIEIQQAQEIKRQQAILEVENALSRARKLYADKQYDAAESTLRNVIQMISILPAGVEMPQALSEAKSLLDKTKSEREVMQAATAEDKRIQAAREAAQYAQTERERQQKVIDELLKNAFTYFHAGEYEKTETLCRIILETDPNHVDASGLLDAATDAMFTRREKELTQLKARAMKEWKVEGAVAEIPQNQVLTYPGLADWQKAGARTPAGFVEEATPSPLEAFAKYRTYPEDKRVTQKQLPFQTEVNARTVEDLLVLPVSLEVREPELALDQLATTVREVLDEIALQTGLNIFCSSTLQSAAGPLAETEAPLFYLIDVEAGVALDLLLNSFGFGYQIASNNTIVVVPLSDASKVVTKAYDINDLLVNVTDFTGGGGGFMAPAKLLIDMTQLVTWIQANVAPSTWTALPGAPAANITTFTGDVRVGTITVVPSWGMMFVRQTLAVHEELDRFLSVLRGVLKELMLVSLQINIITLEDNQLKKIGIEWRGLDVEGASDVQSPGFVSPRSDLTSDLRVGASLPISTLGTLDTGGGVSIDYAVLRDWQARAFVNLVEKVAGTEAVQSPNVTLMQNEVGYIQVTDQRPYVSGWSSDVSEDSSSLTPTVSTQSIGTVLSALATITADRRYVYITVAPSFTELKGFVPVEAVTTTGTVTNKTVANIPLVTTTQLGASAKVPDGGTLVLGGLVSVQNSTAETRVPLLGSIPILGNLFRSHGRGQGRTTLIVMLTPHVVDYEEYEADIEKWGRMAPSNLPSSVAPVESVPTPSTGD